MRTGSFSYGGLASLSGIEVKYTPKAIEEGDEIAVEYGRLPQKEKRLFPAKWRKNSKENSV